MNYHLVILKHKYLDLILSGQKTIESRLTKTRRAPFEMVQPGDTVFMKATSGPVTAIATVLAVRNLSDLTPKDVDDLNRHYNGQICGDNQYWSDKRNSKFATIIWLSDPKPIPPIKITKRDMRAWVVLSKNSHFGLLKKT